jgi:hypothetical protein
MINNLQCDYIKIKITWLKMVNNSAKNHARVVGFAYPFMEDLKNICKVKNKYLSGS